MTNTGCGWSCQPTLPLLALSFICTSFVSPIAIGAGAYTRLRQSKDDMECVHTLYVKTGSVIKAGTDSKISLALGDSEGRSACVPDLQKWGLMGPSHNYYERGNMDAFSGRGPCIGSPICRLNLTSDGSGHNHGWYCDEVEVTSSGPGRPCSQTVFYVDRWLARDAPPYNLTAVLDGCGSKPNFPDGASAHANANASPQAEQVLVV